MVVPLKIDCDGVTVFYGTVPAYAYACIRSLVNCKTDEQVSEMIRLMMFGDGIAKLAMHKPKPKKARWWRRSA